MSVASKQLCEEEKYKDPPSSENTDGHETGKFPNFLFFPQLLVVYETHKLTSHC